MTTIADYRTGVGTRVRDDADRLSTAQLEDLIGEAVRTYSSDRPRQVDEAITGDGTTKVFAVPSLWVETFSRVTGYEWPIDDVPVQLRRPQDYLDVARRDNADMLVTLASVLSAGERARVHFTTPHTVDDVTDTVPPGDRSAVIDLAASLAAMSLAGFYVEGVDLAVGADYANHQAKVSNLLAISTALREAYKAHLTAAPETRQPALVLGTLDLESNGYRRALLFHRRRI